WTWQIAAQGPRWWQRTCRLLNMHAHSSFPWMRESGVVKRYWAPAFAGATKLWPSILFLMCVVFAALPARAHEFKLDAVINAFVNIDRNEAHLVVRAPLYVFKAAKFPQKGAEVDVDNAAPAIERALQALQQDITLFEDGKPLAPLRSRGRLSLPS